MPIQHVELASEQFINKNRWSTNYNDAKHTTTTWTIDLFKQVRYLWQWFGEKFLSLFFIVLDSFMFGIRWSGCWLVCCLLDLRAYRITSWCLANWLYFFRLDCFFWLSRLKGQIQMQNKSVLLWYFTMMWTYNRRTSGQGKGLRNWLMWMQAHLNQKWQVLCCLKKGQRRAHTL